MNTCMGRWLCLDQDRKTKGIRRSGEGRGNFFLFETFKV